MTFWVNALSAGRWSGTLHQVTQSGGGATQWGWARTGARHEPSPFIGRAVELEAVRKAITRSRLITLTGPGGVGKTRIALRAAHQMSVDFPDGVSIAELSGLHDAEMLASAVGLPEIAAQHPMDQLMEYFADKRALLVLDTCEHKRTADAHVEHILGKLGFSSRSQVAAMVGALKEDPPPSS